MLSATPADASVKLVRFAKRGMDFLFVRSIGSLVTHRTTFATFRRVFQSRSIVQQLSQLSPTTPSRFLSHQTH